MKTWTVNLALNTGHVVINILPAIPTEDLKKEDIPDLIERTHKVMSEYMDQLRADNGAKSSNNNGNNKLKTN